MRRERERERDGKMMKERWRERERFLLRAVVITSLQQQKAAVAA